MNIYSHDDQSFLNRLTEITEANLTNDQFGVSILAREMAMSRSHLHRRIKAITNQSISYFIRTVRLKKAMQILQGREVSASEIAYDVGFSSPSYFNHCFHEYFGFPPGEVKKRFIEELPGIHLSDTSDLQPEKLDVEALTTQNKKIVIKRTFHIGIVVFSLLIFTVVSYFLIMGGDNFLSHLFQPKKELSIIVLPFKNLSEDPTNQYFAEGITEDILNSLYWITSLRVVSRTSAEQLSKSNLTVREIARQMKVNYVLEGSVRKYEDKTRISVQLIDASSDGHLWSSSFDPVMTDIITVQNEIAMQVAMKLKAVLSKNEIKQVEKIPTQNSVAYDYYLQARFLLHKANSPQRSGFDKAGAMSCIQFYEKAIAEDKNFAEAYAGLANAWLNLTAWGYLDSNEGFLKGREFSLKALEIDPECAQAHAVLGTFLVWGIRNLEEGGKALETSIRLNPNFATARQWYAQYLMITGPIEKARLQVNRALELEPYFWVVQNLNSWIYYFEEKFTESLAACAVAYDYNQAFSSNEWLFVLNYAKLGEGEKMAQRLQRIAKIYSGTGKYSDDIQNAFAQEGIGGLFYWLIDANKYNPVPVEGMNGHPFYIAWWNAILGNKEESIYWLGKTLNHPRPPYHYFNLITTNPDFDILRDDPRFLKIIDEIGLTPYHNRKAK